MTMSLLLITSMYMVLHTNIVCCLEQAGLTRHNLCHTNLIHVLPKVQILVL